MTYEATSPRLSRLAIFGLLLSISAYPLGFAAFLMIGPCHPPTDWRGTAGPVLGLLAIASVVLGPLLSVIAIVRIACSGGKSWGVGIAITGIAFIVPIVWIVARNF